MSEQSKTAEVKALNPYPVTAKYLGSPEVLAAIEAMAQSKMPLDVARQVIQLKSAIFELNNGLRKRAVDLAAALRKGPVEEGKEPLTDAEINAKVAENLEQISKAPLSGLPLLRYADLKDHLKLTPNEYVVLRGYIIRE